MTHAKRCETCEYWEVAHNGAVGYCWNLECRYFGKMALWNDRRKCWTPRRDKAATCKESLQVPPCGKEDEG